MIWMLILFLTVAGWLLLRWIETVLIFRRTRRVETCPSDIGLEYEDIDFVAEDGVRLHGWWVPHPEARGTILICHGNAGNIGGRLWMLEELYPFKLNLFLFDYRGYGQSRGWPTEKGTFRDARAAYEVVRSFHQDSDAPPVVLYGRSLGAAVAAQLALDKPFRGVILESTFTSMHHMGRITYPWVPIGLLLTNHYMTIRKVPHIEAPKLMAHSREDDLIPYSMGLELFNEAHEPKRFVDLYGNHNDCGWRTTPEYVQRTREFLDLVFLPNSDNIAE